MSGGGCIGGPRRDPGELGRSWKPEDSRELVHECVQALLSGCLRLAAALSGRSWQGMAVPGFLRARTLLVDVPSGPGVGWVAVYCAPAAGVRSVVGGLGVPLRASECARSGQRLALWGVRIGRVPWHPCGAL